LAQDAVDQMGPARLVTSDFVLVEVLNGLSRRSAAIRAAGIEAVRAILNGDPSTVIEASRQSLLEALDLYERRNDKTFSLTDCATMVVMRERSIAEILTADSDFEQEGFTILMKR
jgi:hypothetical protein